MTQRVGTTAPMEWRKQGACIDLDTSIFYPPRGGTIDPQAVRACENCPVRAECYDHALRHEAHGYWAGTSERGRKRLRKLTGIRFQGVAPLDTHLGVCGIGHGSANGYRRHLRNGEKACIACAIAHTDANRKRAYAKRSA